MPRAARYFLPDQTLHVIQRGNNRGDVFFAAADYRRYLRFLAEAAAAHGCSVHAYVLMTNHVHLLVTPNCDQALPRTMQALGRRYVRHFNDSYGRTGTLWEGRYRASLIDSEAYFFVCSRYIELNPVRAGLVTHPAAYPWSSYPVHASGASDPVIRDHPLYQALGLTAGARQEAYRSLFDIPLEPAMMESLRAATNGGWAFGDKRFRDEMEQALGRRVSRGSPGRPRRNRGQSGFSIEAVGDNRGGASENPL